MPCSIAAVTMASFASLTLRTIVLEKLLFLVPLRAIVTRKGLERGKMEGVKIRMEQSRVPAVRVEDKRVTSGPFSQNAFVRLDILISMPAKETEQTRRWKEDDRYIPALGQVTKSFKVFWRLLSFSICPKIYYES